MRKATLRSSAYLLGILLMTGPTAAVSKELYFTIGGGSQPSSSHDNRSTGLDFSFYRYERSEKQHLQVGLSYTRIWTNTDQNDDLWALTIYPQLTLYPNADGRFKAKFPTWVAPFFFVRALGPTYLNTKQLGDRKQGKHFALQAQVGFGAKLDLGGKRTGIVAISYKHFSNAGLFTPNDGIDVPLLFSLGIQF